MVESGKIKTKKQLNSKKVSLAKQFELKQVPTNPDILKFSKKSNKTLKQLFSVKPTRSLSGVNVVAVMTTPHVCPGKCVYCPVSLVDSPTPRSYTGLEPSTMRAIRNNFDAYKIVRDRIGQFERTGHNAQKIELVIMGGTFYSQPKKFRENFILDAINGITQKNSKTMNDARIAAENSEKRMVGLTFETRPDYCDNEIVNEMLYYGGTRCELGVQILDDKVNDFTKRFHYIKDVADSTAALKNAGFKVCYHIMPGLPGSSKENDLKKFEKLFSDSRFRPDMLKIYPCLVVKGTPLYHQWEKGEFTPITSDEAADIIAEFNQVIPPYVRVMRVQRDIPATLIESGVQKSNLRQMVEQKMKEKKIKSKDIRTREVGLKSYREQTSPDFGNIKLSTLKYDASNGKEFFISLEDKKTDTLFGFCRLRILPQNVKTFGSFDSIIRELRIFGESLSIGSRNEKASQHKGMGVKLVKEAEKIAKEDFDSKEIAVIAGLGVKEYYRKFFNFENSGFLMSKRI